MMFFRSILFLLPAVCLMAQTPEPKAAPAKPAAKTAAPKPATAQAKPASQAKPAEPAKPAPPPAPAAAAKPGDVPADKVVISVGEEKLTAGEVNRIIEALPEQYRASATGAGRKQFLENLVRVKVLAQEGRRRKLDQDPVYLAQLALQRDNLLAGSTYNAISQSTPIGDEQLKLYYDQHKSEFESVTASHILIRFKGSPAPVRQGQKDLTPEEALAKAQATYKELQAGADFATVAKRDSDDAGSGAQGGALGTFHRGQMVPEFEQVAFNQPVGQVGEPVKTMFGYHIIKVTQREAKSLADARAEIEKKLRPEEAMKAVDSLQKSTNVFIDPQFMGEEKK